MHRNRIWKSVSWCITGLEGRGGEIQRYHQLYSEFKTNLGYIRPHLKKQIKWVFDFIILQNILISYHSKQRGHLRNCQL